MPDTTDVQNASLDAYNAAITRVNAAAQKLNEMQQSQRPSDDSGGRQYDLDYRQAQSALQAAQADAAKAAQSYASLLEQQAKSEANSTDPFAQARTARAQAQAEYYTARADQLGAKDAASAQAAQTRAEAALSRASTAANRVDSLNAASEASAGHLNAQTAQLQSEQQQRDRNQAAGLGALTDSELTASQQRATEFGTTSNQNQQRIDIEKRQTDISAANSAIAAANQKLAEQRAAIEAKVADGNLTLEQAKFEYQKVKDASDNEIAQQKLKLDQAQQQATQQYQQGQLGVQQGQLANQTRTVDLQAQQQAETARANQATQAYRQDEQARAAANDIISAQTNRQNQAAQMGQTGAGLLNQRVQAGTGLLNNLVGLAGSGHLYNVPAGLGAGLVSGVQDFVTGLGGGQGTYDTAAKLVQNLMPGGMQNPLASQAYATLGQMLDKYQQQTGQPHPVAQAIANQGQSQQQQTFTSPQPQQSPTGAPQAAPTITFNFSSPPVAGQFSQEPRMPLSMQGVYG